MTKKSVANLALEASLLKESSHLGATLGLSISFINCVVLLKSNSNVQQTNLCGLFYVDGSAIFIQV
jgi:hypothetical protein